MSEALQTLAYPLQHPGTKMLSAVAVQSTGQGLGKTLVGETIGLLYGEHNTTTIGSADLTGNFNDWALDKQFVVGRRNCDEGGQQARRLQQTERHYYPAHNSCEPEMQAEVCPSRRLHQLLVYQ